MAYHRHHGSNNADANHSLILESRKINDASPAETIRRIEDNFGDVSGKSIALMGTAYRFNSEDTRNSPTLPLAQLLLEKGCQVTMHDRYVKPDDQNLALLVGLALQRQQVIQAKLEATPTDGPSN